MKKAFIIFVLSFSAISSAIAETYIREYTYKASEADSKITSRINALDQVKVILLQEIGVHIQQEIKIKKNSAGYTSSSEDIEAITAGLTKVNILEEKWDGTSFYIKVKIIADTKQVLKTLEELKKQKNSKLSNLMEQSKINQRNLKIARDEIKKLRKQLLLSGNNQDKEYIISQYQNKVEKINYFSNSNKLSCVANGLIANKKYQKITSREAKSNPALFVVTIEPKVAELIIVQDSNKTIAKFSGQLLKKSDGGFVEDLSLKGVIYDQYIDSGDEIFYQYYVPAGNHDITLYTNIIWLSKKRSTNEAFVVYFECIKK